MYPNEQKAVSNTPIAELETVVPVGGPPVSTLKSRPIENKNRDEIKWPASSTSVAYVLKKRFRIMISIDILTTSSFRIFYSEWLENSQKSGSNALFIANLETETIPSDFENIRVLKYTGCSDYASFLQRIKAIGAWLFITDDEKKAELVRKASQIAGAHLRVYKLDGEGKLQNNRPSIPERQGVSRYTIPLGDTFSLPNQVASMREVVRKSRSVPTQGGMVYDSKNQPVMLQDEYFSNSQSITYHTNRSDMQAKIYQASYLSFSYFEDKAKKMLEKQIQCEGICWPTDLLYDANREFVGVLTPTAAGFQLKQHLMSQLGLETNFPKWDRRNLIHLAKGILQKIVYLHDRNILFGLINPSAIFVKDENHIYFTEMDTYQIEGYPIMSYERVMQAPELQEEAGGLRLYTKQQDYYGIALLLFILLMPGKFPYNKGANKNVSESVRQMSFAFSYGGKQGEHGSKESFGLWRFVWSHLGNDLKRAFYDTFQKGQPLNMPEKRRDGRFWLGK